MPDFTQQTKELSLTAEKNFGSEGSYSSQSVVVQLLMRPKCSSTPKLKASPIPRHTRNLDPTAHTPRAHRAERSHSRLSPTLGRLPLPISLRSPSPILAATFMPPREEERKRTTQGRENGTRRAISFGKGVSW